MNNSLCEAFRRLNGPWFAERPSPSSALRAPSPSGRRRRSGATWRFRVQRSAPANGERARLGCGGTRLAWCNGPCGACTNARTAAVRAGCARRWQGRLIDCGAPGFFARARKTARGARAVPEHFGATRFVDGTAYLKKAKEDVW